MEILRNGDVVEMGEEGGEVFEVTNIKQGVKNPNRANIFINGEYLFSLDIAQLVDFKLKVGAKITVEELAEYRKASDFGKLYQRTLEWVLMRPRSVKETQDYLYRTVKKSSMIRKRAESSFRGHPQLLRGRSDETREDGLEERPRKESFCSDIIERLVSKGYLDDRVFAEYYVENRFTKKGISEKRLKMELMKKGVSQQIISEVLAKNLRNDEEEIKKIIAKKIHKYDEEKLIQYLIRQGFDFELARNLVRTKLSSTDETD